jgi:hypothetical protein
VLGEVPDCAVETAAGRKAAGARCAASAAVADGDGVSEGCHAVIRGAVKTAHGGGPMRYIVLAMIMVVTCLNLNTAQAVAPYERESLAGLPGVVVVVETITPEVQAEGLTEEAIQAAVESILQSSGIRLFIESKKLKVSSNPWLYVQPNIGKGGPYYFYNVSLRLIQEVASVHGRQHTMPATTWEGNTAGIVNDNDLRDVILDAIERWTKIFANDFLTVNPREGFTRYKE